jgi:uncharacterized protein (DUF2164 family)
MLSFVTPVMAKTPSTRIRLSPERRAALVVTTKKYFFGEFDEELSDFRAEALLDFFLRQLGPPVYNQGVRDAVGYIQEKLGDIEGDIVEIDNGAGPPATKGTKTI